MDKKLQHSYKLKHYTVPIIVVYPLKISLSADKFYVLKTGSMRKMSSIEDKGCLSSKTVGISRNFCSSHPLQIERYAALIANGLTKLNASNSQTLFCNNKRHMLIAGNRFSRPDVIRPTKTLFWLIQSLIPASGF